MINTPTTNRAEPLNAQTEPDSEAVIRQLEQFSIEALEAALFVLQLRKQDRTT
jgi:hypothetical protein